MLAPQLIDDFGAWDDLGEVIPRTDQFTELPNFSLSESALIRLNYGGDIDNAQSYAQIRGVYRLFNTEIFADWVRVYPKFQSEIISYAHPPEFNLLKVRGERYFQVRKYHNRRRFIGTHPDSQWTINIQICNEEVQLEEVEPENVLPLLGFI